MRKVCDLCNTSMRKVGKLLKTKSLMLCKSCRKKFARRRI